MPRGQMPSMPCVLRFFTATLAGYGTEALSYIAGLLQGNLVSHKDVWVTQSGDVAKQVIQDSMEPGLRALLWEQEYRNITKVSQHYHHRRGHLRLHTVLASTTTFVGRLCSCWLL